MTKIILTFKLKNTRCLLKYYKQFFYVKNECTFIIKIQLYKNEIT
jgi:hypothetical protein